MEPLTETDTFGTTGTRTTNYTYDADQRQTSQAVTVSGTGMGAAIPSTQTVYSTTTGAVADIEQLNSSGAVTSTIADTYDDFGDLLTYTDSTGTESVYTYNLDGTVATVNDGKATDTLTYNTAREPVSEVDSQAGTFTGTYDADGNLVTADYPDGTVATTTVDPAGADTSLTYTNSAWTASIGDSAEYDAQGNLVERDELSGAYAYAYDADNRLTSVNDDQDGQCTVDDYSYDADSNRTAATAYSPSSSGACQTSTGTAETYSYDAADRLLDTSVAGASANDYVYDTQGDITDTPSVDAGNSGDLTATYFANDMTATQTQDGDTKSWTLDAVQDRYLTQSDSTSGVTTTDHYANSSDSPTWSSSSNGSWSRNVGGLTGELSVIVTSAGTSLQLLDLQGSVMATVDYSSNSDAIANSSGYTAFGAPESGAASTYGYLGGAERAGSGEDSQVLMGQRDYNPYTGRFNQGDPVSQGGVNAYDYTNQNPLTNSDVSGTTVVSGWGCSTSSRDWGMVHTIACTIYLTRAFSAYVYDFYEGPGSVLMLAADAACVVVGEVFAPACILGFVIYEADLFHAADEAHYVGGCITANFADVNAMGFINVPGFGFGDVRPGGRCH